MSPVVKDAVISFLGRNIIGKKRFFLSWFGGEPLIERRSVLDITKSCFSACLDNSVLMETDITTNAMFIDRELLEELAQYGKIRFQITLDGPKKYHNLRRISPNGSDTFGPIVKAIKQIVEYKADFEVLARIHYDAESAVEVVEFAKEVSGWIEGKGSVFVRPISNLGGKNDCTTVLTDEETDKRIGRELAQLGLSVHSAEEQVCYAALPNALVIRADGKVSKCTVALESSKNLVGNITEAGELKLNENINGWLKGWYEGDVSALKCPYSKIAKS